MDRMVLRDDQWERIALLFRERLEIRGVQGLTTAFLSKRFCGLFGLERPGATFPRISGSGTRSFSAFDTAGEFPMRL